MHFVLKTYPNQFLFKYLNGVLLKDNKFDNSGLAHQIF